MEKFSDWMLRTIREESNQGILSGWLEEDRFKWTKIVSNALTQLLNGTTFLLICDTQRQWLKHYILSQINQKHKNRPLVPILDFPSSLGQTSNFQVIKDVLNIAYKDYIFFYIGKRDNPLAELCIGHENSLLWVLDESIQNAFCLNSTHPMLDFRLLQLYKIFDFAISACIFENFDLEE